jgi:hypothetical protein
VKNIGVGAFESCKMSDCGIWKSLLVSQAWQVSSLEVGEGEKGMYIKANRKLYPSDGTRLSYHLTTCSIVNKNYPDSIL